MPVIWDIVKISRLHFWVLIKLPLKFSVRLKVDLKSQQLSRRTALIFFRTPICIVSEVHCAALAKSYTYWRTPDQNGSNTNFDGQHIIIWHVLISHRLPAGSQSVYGQQRQESVPSLLVPWPWGPSPDVRILWAFLFLQEYAAEHLTSAVCRVDEKTNRKWVWFYVKLMAHLNTVCTFRLLLISSLGLCI